MQNVTSNSHEKVSPPSMKVASADFHSNGHVATTPRKHESRYADFHSKAMVVFFLLSGSVFGQSDATDDKEATQGRYNLPVIIHTEVVTTGVCRLHYEDGTFREVSCKKTHQRIS